MRPASNRVLVLVVTLLTNIVAARAEESRVAASAKPLRAGFFYYLNSDCSSMGDVVVRLTESPRFGTVRIARARSNPNFLATNERHACNTRKVPGTIAEYRSRRGYVGEDRFTLDIIYPQGSAKQLSYLVSVR